MTGRSVWVWVAMLGAVCGLAVVRDAEAGQYNCEVPVAVLCQGCATDVSIALPEFWGEVQPPASLKGLDIPSRRADFVPWKPSRRRGFRMGNPTFR